MSELNREKLENKMNIRSIFSVAKCGGGFHIKISPRIAKAFKLESGDEVLVTFHEVRYATIREE